jgi:hypothetical protein
MAALAPPHACSDIPNRASVLQCNDWPLNVHALLPARQFVPAKVRCFLDALEAHTRNGAAAEVEA